MCLCIQGCRSEKDRGEPKRKREGGVAGREGGMARVQGKEGKRERWRGGEGGREGAVDDRGVRVSFERALVAGGEMLLKVLLPPSQRREL